MTRVMDHGHVVRDSNWCGHLKLIDIFFSPRCCCRVKEFFCIEEGIYQARTPCKLAIIIIANR